MPVRIYYWRIIAVGRRGDEQKDGTIGRRKTKTSTRVVRGKKGRSSEKWRTCLFVRARETKGKE